MEHIKSNNEEALRIGVGIYNQLGANQFKTMTGSEINIAGFPDYYSNYGLFVKLIKNKSEANCLVIIYNRGTDLYDMVFYRKTANTFEITSEHQGCYGDMLKSIFTSETGLLCSMNQYHN